MSEILETNLSYIRKHNPSLCEKVCAVKELTKNFDIKPNLIGEYNLIIEGKAVHSVSGAQDEAKNVFDSLPHNTQNSIHVIFGLGLGYLPDYFIENTKGCVIVFEPDIETLAVALDAVDFSDSFKKDRIYFASDMDEFGVILETLFRYQSKGSLSVLDYHKFQCKSAYESFKDDYFKLFELLDFNFKYQVNQTYAFLKSTVTDLSKKYQRPLLTDYKDILKGKTAIIVSAGPSLHKNIDILKKYKDNAIIFCVGTALRTLANNGITPDFLNIIERNNTSFHYNLPCTKDIVLITEAFAESSVYNIEFKKHFLTASLETDSSRWFLETAQKDFVEFETKGTVSYHALSCAKYLGCTNIILIGQDLAYTDGKCYAKGSAFEGLECVKNEETGEYKIYPKDFDAFRDAYYASVNWTLEYKNKKLEIKLKELNNGIKFVASQDGKKMPTDPGYALYIEYIKEFAKKHNKELTLINSSIGGALIEGFETITLAQACEKFAQTPLNKRELFGFSNVKCDFNKEIIIKNLENDLYSLKKIQKYFANGIDIIVKTEKIIEGTQHCTHKITDLLGKAANIYVEITNKYTNNNRLLKIIAMKEHSEIVYLMKEAPENMGIEEAKNLFNLLKDYFVNVPIKVNETIKLLEHAIEGM